MTTIVSVTNGDMSVIASDSSVSYDNVIRVSNDPKIFGFMDKNGRAFGIGMAGDAVAVRAIAQWQRLNQGLDMDVDDPEFKTNLWLALNHMMKSYIGTVENKWSALVATSEFLFRIESEQLEAEFAECYDAVGVGQSFALGAMCSLIESNKNDEEFWELPMEPQATAYYGVLAATKLSPSLAPVNTLAILRDRYVE